MKMDAFFAGLVALAAMPGSASAQDAWAPGRKVISLYPKADGFTFVLDGPRVNLGSPCEANRMVLPLTAPNYDAIVSSILTAFSSGYVIDVAYDASSIAGCETIVNRVVVYRRN